MLFEELLELGFFFIGILLAVPSRELGFFSICFFIGGVRWILFRLGLEADLSLGLPRP